MSRVLCVADSPFAQLTRVLLDLVQSCKPWQTCFPRRTQPSDSQLEEVQLEEVGVGVGTQKKMIETGFTSLRVAPIFA